MKKTKKHSFHWWSIPLWILAAVLALTLFLGIFAGLPPKNYLALTSNFQLKLSPGVSQWIQGGERDYSSLPELMVMADGTPVTTVSQFEERRKEILNLFSENVYGPIPMDGFETSFRVMEEGEAYDGTALRRQVEISVSTPKGTSQALMLLYLPKSVSSAPVILALNFNGNHTVSSDPAILPSPALTSAQEDLDSSRGSKTSRWDIEAALNRGCAVATIYYGDFAMDDAKTYDQRIISLFDEPDFKAVSAWAFGLMRGVDCLLTMPEIDPQRIADMGHSRLGKAAVWAGANDERIALVISNDSGNTGASLSRENRGETVSSINRMFPHWFCDAYDGYGRSNVSRLPVDQHMLLACVAPRHLYVASAQSDLWADPVGAFTSFQHARPAFQLYGLETPPDMEAPQVDTPLWSESMGYHVRTGWHDVLAWDWNAYLSYMEQYLPA